MSDDGCRPSFNLIDEAWIPCRGADGAFQELGIRDVLLRAHELHGIEDGSPLVTMALIRMLLAVLHRTTEGPRNDADWRRTWQSGRFDQGAVDGYLERWRDRFDLFHADYPFMQVANLGLAEDAWLPPSALRVELASGNNDTLFDHSHDQQPMSWEAKAAARSLVALQSFALGGGICAGSRRFGKHPNRTHAPGVGRLFVLVQGNNLFETLALNLVSYPANPKIAPEGTLEGDAPCWERETVAPPGVREIAGYTDYLTWSSRAVLFHREPDGRVPRVDLTSLHQLPDRSIGWRDPLALHTKNKDEEVVPLVLRPDRALWRDSSSLIPTDPALHVETVQRAAREILRDERFPETGLVVLGMANDKAKVNLWREETLPLPRDILVDDDLRQAVVEAVSAVAEVGAALRSQLRSFASGCLQVGEARPQGNAVTAFVRQLGAMERFWDSLDGPFLVLLRDVARDPSEAADAFIGSARAGAVSVFRVVTEGALGRNPRELRLRVRGEAALRRVLSTTEGVAQR